MVLGRNRLSINIYRNFISFYPEKRTIRQLPLYFYSNSIRRHYIATSSFITSVYENKQTINRKLQSTICKETNKNLDPPKQETMNETLVEPTTAATTVSQSTNNVVVVENDNKETDNNMKRKLVVENKECKKKKGQEPKGAGYHTRRGRQHDTTPHEGSFAHIVMREQFAGHSLGSIPTNSDTNKTVKRKVAIAFGYVGTNYGGFQMNKNQHTLQSELELALYKANLLSSLNIGHPQKYSFSSSARTDKGVHACAQVCSCKIQFPDGTSVEAIRQRIQELLPSDIQIFDIIRTTRNFCAKTQRDKVQYQYMIPSFVLHNNIQQVFRDHAIPFDRSADGKTPLLPEEIQKLQTSLKSYRSTVEQRTVLQNALRKYEGTHPFHNFTKGMKRGQAQAFRYILSFTVQDPIIVNDVEWIPTQVLGQSFLLHQIRKMISLVIDVTRGTVPISILDKALHKDNDTVRVSLAPAQGLFLEQSYFDGYNRRKQDNSSALSDLDLTNKSAVAHERWKSFRSTVRNCIVTDEETKGNFIQYLYIQECIFDYRQFYGLDTATSTTTTTSATTTVTTT